MTTEITGSVFRRNDAGYEQARRKTVWHQGVPDRFPQIIVQAKNEQDVIAAVKLARSEGLKLAVRSGGHSWAGSHLRDNSLLIDLSQWKEVTIDSKNKTATAQPAISGATLAELLQQQNLYFPIGHCEGVCLGGYLLQGGFGWRGRELGPACMSVIGIDVITAQGEKIHASEKQNADLFWAARGAGPGFFAVVTRFYLQLYPLQKFTLSSYYIYPPKVWEEYLRWSHAIGPSLPAEVELWNLMYRDNTLATDGPVISASVTAFTDNEDQAKNALAIFETCPVRDHAIEARLNFPTTTGELTRVNMQLHYPATRRFIADNMWTHASFDELLPELKKIHATFPAAPSHMVWFPWRLLPKRPDMAYSLEDQLYLALYGAGEHAAEDAFYRDWVTNHMRAMESIATGMQLADENLLNRPRPFMKEQNLHRFDEIRSVYDPDARFVSWLGRPGGEKNHV